MVLYTASAEHLQTLPAQLFVGRWWFGRPWGWLRAEIQRFVQKLETPEIELLQLCQKRAPKGTPFSHFFTLSSDEEVSLITEYLQSIRWRHVLLAPGCLMLNQNSCLKLSYWACLSCFIIFHTLYTATCFVGSPPDNFQVDQRIQNQHPKGRSHGRRSRQTRWKTQYNEVATTQSEFVTSVS